MKDWKVRQEVYHRLNDEFNDDLNKVDIRLEDDVKRYALMHFESRVNEWIYPAKSFFVAYCYAYWISVDFNEDFWELIKDPNLLYGNDPYFKPYNEETANVYDFLFDMVDWPIKMIGMVPDVYDYYRKEMMLDD